MVATERADVVVVGGGPAGSSTATHLARAGLHVVLFDKARFPREKACAEYCSPGVVDALDDLGALAHLQASPHRELSGMRITTPTEDFRLDFARDRPEGHRALGMKRSSLDFELLRFASNHGVDIRDGTRVRAPIIDHGRVTGVRYKNGSSEGEIRSEFVVAADGLHSMVTRALGTDRRVRWPHRLGLVARYACRDGLESIGQMHVGNGIYCGLSPVEDNVVNVALVVPMEAKPRGVSTGEFFEQSLKALPGIAAELAGAERVTRVRGLGPLARNVRHVAGNGYLAVGDAAGFFDPLTGEGVHRALRGGELAAMATLDALEQPERFPAGYRRARSEHFGDKERVCQIIQLLLTSGTTLNYAARRAAKREPVNRLLCGVLGDYVSAKAALRPSFLWHLFRP